MNSQRLVFLDGLRGLAATAVILFHCHYLIAEQLATPLPFWINQIFESGHLGVQIFFVLSGFVIAYSTRDARFTLSFFKSFIIRRSIRLDPPYWVVVCGLVAISMLGSLAFAKKELYPLSFREVAANLGYLHGLFGVPYILPASWSLCLELQLYTVLVLSLVAVRTIDEKLYSGNSFFNSRVFYAFFGLLSLFCLACDAGWVAIFEGIPKNALFVYCWHQFFLGALACWVLYRNLPEKWFYGFASVVAVRLWFHYSGNDMIVLITALVIFWVGKRQSLSSLLQSRFFQWSGKISYSLYLIQWPTGMKFLDVLKEHVLNGKVDLLTGGLLYLAAVMLIFICGHLFHRWVEEPCLQWSKRLAKVQPKAT